MPSLFSRSKSSTLPANGGTDEFGRVDSRGSGTGTPSKKDKKAATAAARLRTLSTPTEPTDYSRDPAYALPPDGTFLPLSLSPADHGDHSEPVLDYGYLFYEKEIVLGVDDVARIVQVVGSELALRGLTTPLLFSTLALDVSLPFIKRIISAFLRTCPYPTSSSDAKARWLDEARVASPHDLAMTLRWALARIVRVERGAEARGIFTLDAYSRWRAQESTLHFPQNHFSTFRDSIDNSDVRALLDSLFALLSRLTANSTSSGLTPTTLASLFGPLLFGLGASSSTFQVAYAYYLRSTHATEHLLLAYIRQSPNLPPRLADWVRGYPAMLPSTNQLDSARRGARTVRVLAVRRNVRMYASDLVRSGAAWQMPPTSKEWARITANDTRAPRYSDTYRKRLNLPVTFVPDGAPSDAKQKQFDAESVVEAERFRSLTDLKWGEFETLGFGTPDDTKLQFDLTESARKARTEKRATLTWNDFSSSGFSRTDAPLSATLQFSAPLLTTINDMGAQHAELHRKLKKAQRALPAFGWDTKPVIGAEELIEEAFLDVFADLIWSAGWQDRREQTFRDCNWAMVEYKCTGGSRSRLSPNADPRTGTQLVLYEEFVPSEYRAQLNAPKKRLRLPFTARSQQKWKPATTLNGRPYAIGAVPKSPSQRELDFEQMLNDKSAAATKVISMHGAVRSASPPLPPVPNKAGVTPSVQIVIPDKEKAAHGAPAADGNHTTSPLFARTALSASRFRVGKRREGLTLIPSQYDTVEFETRETDDLTDEDVPATNKHERRQSRDDAWVDILVASGSRRMPGQDAELPTPAAARRRGYLGGGRGNRSDPELAREEVERVLAAAGRRPSEDEDVLRYGAPAAAMPGIPPRESVDEPVHRVRDSVDSVDFEPVHMRSASQDAAPPTPSEDGAPTTASEVPEEEEVHRGSMYSEAESEDSMLPPPPPLPVDPVASGRQSPGRYIHGQPLHNVVEAEEEED